MSHCILLNLPESIARLVLVEWLRVNHLPRLDSAFCSCELRALFFILAYGTLTVFSGAVSRNIHDVNIKPVLEWAITRKAQLDGIFIGVQLLQHENALPAFLAISGVAITWVKIVSHQEAGATLFGQQALLEVAKWCPNVKLLEVHAAQTKPGCTLWDDQLVEFTGSCRQLTELSLIDAQLSQHGLGSALNNCKSLQLLSIGTQNQMIPVDIAVPTLKSIKCNGRSMTDAALVAIGEQCAELETLTIFATNHKVTDTGVRAVLQGCPLLRFTDVEYAKGISTELRVELARRRDLTVLRTAEWLRMDNELMQGVLKVSPNLTALRCAGCSERLSDATLVVCAQHCPLVQDVELFKCPDVTDAGVQTLVSSVASKLHSMDLRACPQLSDNTLLAVAEHCPLLKKIIWNQSASDAAVVKLARGCPELSYVYLYKTEIGDAGVAAVATHCSELKALYLYHSPHITAQGARQVISSCQHLRHLGLPAHLREELQPLRSSLPATLRVTYSWTS
jgi:hypothetical protein